MEAARLLPVTRRAPYGTDGSYLVDHVIPHVPVRQRVLSLPIPRRLLLAAEPKLVTPALQVVHRMITRHLFGQAGLKSEEADSGAPDRLVGRA